MFFHKNIGGPTTFEQKDVALSEDWTEEVHATQTYIFEDNSSVIQMINRGRAPTLKHATRTHRVDLDWLSERAN